MSEDSDGSASDGTDGHAAENTDGGPAVVDGEALIAEFVDSGVLIEEAEDLRLTDDFREEWWTRIEAVRGAERTRLGELVGLDPAALELEADGDGFVAIHDGEEIGDWPSRAAFVADVALQPTIAGWLPLWERIDPLSRAELLGRLRAFLDRCPACDGSLEVAEWTADGRTETTITCEECGQTTVNTELG